MAGKFNKYTIGEEKRSTRFFSSQQEKAVARATGGKQTANSGATAFQKGDVVSNLFLLECKTKTTASDTMTVHKSWITKNLDESIFMHKPYSAVVINFGPGEENYYIINEELFQTLQEYLEEQRNET